MSNKFDLKICANVLSLNKEGLTNVQRDIVHTANRVLQSTQYRLHQLHPAARI